MAVPPQSTPCFHLTRSSGQNSRLRLFLLAGLPVLMGATVAGWGQLAQAQPSPTDFINRMDTDGNGLLDPGEVSDRARGFIGPALAEKGYNLDRPIPIDKVAKIMSERFDRMRRERESSGSSNSSSSSRSSRDDDDRRRDDDRDRDRGSSSKRDAAAVALVPGFGNEFELAPVLGFEALSNADDSWEELYDRRTMETVRDMIRRYDRNDNGVLDREEWKHASWRTPPEGSDLDKDGRLTRKELAIRLAGFRSDESSRDSDRDRGGDDRGGWSSRGGFFGSRESSGGSSSDRPSSSSSSSSSAKRDSPPSYRFRTPTERLPKGLPEWFARKDTSADGQVAMAEFALDWNADEIAAFRRWDHNGDGLISASECLAGEKVAEGAATGSNAAGTASTASTPTSTSSSYQRPASSSSSPSATGSSGSTSGGTTGSSTSSNSGGSSSGGSSSSRYVDYYTNMFRSRDENKNGSLEGSEITTSIARADRNGDGKITLQELLETYTRR